MMHANHTPQRTIAALMNVDIYQATQVAHVVLCASKGAATHAHCYFILVPFIAWLTCLHRRAAHDVEPKNHQQEHKKLPNVSAVAARWTIPNRLVSVRKKNRARVHRRNLHLERVRRHWLPT